MVLPPTLILIKVPEMSALLFSCTFLHPKPILAFATNVF